MSADAPGVSAIARLKRKLGDGTSVLFMTYGVTAVLRLGSNMILTRLLAPEAFGLSVIITAVIYILNLISDIGTNSFIIRHDTADDKVLRVVWTVKVVRSLILSSVMFLTAGLFAQLYNTPELTTAIRVSALIFILNGFTSMGHILAVRDRRIMRLSMLDFYSFIISTVITIVAALILRNYWAFVVGSFVTSFTSLIFSYTMFQRAPFGFSWDPEVRKEIWNFSKFVLPSSMITIFLTQFDKFVMANSFPIEELGFYMLSFGLMTALNQLRSRYEGRVFSPKFANLRRTAREELPKAFYTLRLRFMLLLAAIYGALAGGSDLVVQALFDDRYERAAFYLMLVAVGQIGNLSNNSANEALVNLGHMRATMVASIARLIWMVCAVPAALYLFGPIGMIVAIHLSFWVLKFFLMWRLGREGIFDLRYETAFMAAAAVGAGAGFAASAAAEALIAAGVLPNF